MRNRAGSDLSCRFPEDLHQLGQGMAARTKPKERLSRLSDLLASLYYEGRREYGTDLSHRAIRLLQRVAYSDPPPRIDDIAKFMDCAASTVRSFWKLRMME